MDIISFPGPLVFRRDEEVFAAEERMRVSELWLQAEGGRRRLLDILAKYTDTEHHNYVYEADQAGLFTEKQDFELLFGFDVDLNPAISPDGCRVAYIKRGFIWVAELSGLEN